MKIIGLTGGIGTGKSTVARFLAELSAVILDTDKAGHEALKSGTETWQQVVTAFGKQIITVSGEIDRQKLGEIVFADPAALARLNQIVHPVIHKAVMAQLEKYRRQGTGVLVLEAPLLVEAGWDSVVNEVWVTTATEATVLQRLNDRTGLSEQEAQSRIRSQISTEERLKHANVIIDTDCTLAELKTKIKELWQKV